MSASMYEGQVRTHERNLQGAQKKQAESLAKVARLEKEIAGLQKRAATASSASTARSYQSRIESRTRELQSARDAQVRAAQTVASYQEKLSTAQRRLADARVTERRREAGKEARDRRQQEQRERFQAWQRQSAERRAHQVQQQREAERERTIEALTERTTELERQLAEAERRGAPPSITVLFLAASPEDQPSLRLDQETREIQKRVRESDYRESIWFEWRLARRLTDLIQDLNEVRPNVIHFSGHGNSGELAFEDASGATASLDNQQLGKLLEVAGPRVRLMVFNSCDSATQAELASAHVDVAIGMDSTVEDDAAKTFAGQFYNSLGFGHSVSEAFREATLQMEFAHGEDVAKPRLFVKDGLDPETVVLVNPDGNE